MCHVCFSLVAHLDYQLVPSSSGRQSPTLAMLTSVIAILGCGRRKTSAVPRRATSLPFDTNTLGLPERGVRCPPGPRRKCSTVNNIQLVNTSLVLDTNLLQSR